MDNLEHVAQETLPEQETLDVNRWEDDGGQETPTSAPLKASHHQTPSSQAQRPQESAAVASLADDSPERSEEKHG
ncbi:MAG TPA: hypothetical protein VF792_03215 [Ktedonobacterales bacterium]